MQALFEWDFNNYSGDRAEAAVARLAQEFAPGLDDLSFAKTLAGGVVSEKEKLDHIISKAAPDWPLPQIAIVDRNIIRLGLYELLFGNKGEVPARVAINESIELAKTFGGENSGRFVNGVLGAVYKEMGEPGKDDIPAKKKRPKDVPYEQMPIEKLVGAVVYCRAENEIFLALVHDVFSYWTLSKGHVEEKEDLLTATKREIKEELGLTITVGEAIGTNEYIASDPERGKIRKQVNYFLAESKVKTPLTIGPDKGGLLEAKWFPLEAVLDLKIYDDILPIITTAIKHLT